MAYMILFCESLWRYVKMPHAEKSNPDKSTWCDLTHRTHTTYGCLWSLSELEAWLKCGPSWTVVFPVHTHAYSAMLLPMEIPTLLQMVIFTAQRKNSGGFHVEFSAGEGTVVFPLFPEKRQSIFSPWHCVTDGTLFSGHISSVSAEVLLWCWQHLGTQTSIPLNSRLCWNCPISRCTDHLLDSAVHSLSFSCVCHRWNMGTMPLCGTQQCWSTWPSTMRSAPSTRWGTRSRTEDTGSPCSMAAPTEMSSHKGKPLQ